MSKKNTTFVDTKHKLMMKFKTSVSAREIWTITLPIIFGNLAQSLIAIIDTAFLGRLGEVALGASMMSAIFYFIFATLPWGFAVGIQILIARRLGENRPDRIGVIFQHGLRTMAIFAAVLLSVLYFFTPAILSAAITSPNILAASKEFMSYRIYGIIFVCFNYLSRYFFIGISNTKIITVTTTVMALVNIVLDYGLIFGELGLPKMGIGGAALASVIAEMSATIVFIVYYGYFFNHKRFELFSYHKLEGWLIGHLLKLATPTMVQKLLGFSIWFIFFTFVEEMGETSIAVSGIIRSLFMLLGVGLFAFGATANTITSRIIGEGKGAEVRTTLAKITMYSYLFLIPIVALCFIYPDPILSIYTSDEALKLASIDTLHILCLAMAAYVPGIVFFEAMSGTGNTTHALIVEMLVLAVYFAGILFLIDVLHVGVAGAWLCESIYGAFMLVFSYLYLRYYNWEKKQI